jgi:hypothetical protein
MNNFVERSAVGLVDWGERPVGGISEPEQVGHDVVVRHAEDRTRLVLIAD